MAVSRDEVVKTAVRILKDEGLHAVTFRRLAMELGISAPTLYWHIRDKRELLDRMSAAMVNDYRLSDKPMPEGLSWDEKIAEAMRRQYRALIAYRDGPLVVAGNRPLPEMLPRIEQWLSLWTDAGFPPAEALASVLAIGNYVLGSALEYQAEGDRETARREAGREREPIPKDKFPILGAAAGARGGDRQAGFEHGLMLMMTGLRARRAELLKE